MGILDRIAQVRKKRTDTEKQVASYFRMMNAYKPVFTTLEGGVYEMELTRAAIHSFATHASKLMPIVEGTGNAAFERRIQQMPNAHMTSSQYLYKLATLLMVDNTAFIMPLYEEDEKTVAGYYPVRAQSVALQEHDGREYFRFQLPAGRVSIERSKVGVLNQFLFKSDIYGESNRALGPTMELINTTNQGIINGIKNSAYIRFIAKLGMPLNPEDVEEERRRLTSGNLASENAGGVFLVDTKYEDVKQVQSQAYTVDPKQMELIRQNVYFYFGTNEAILTNKFNSDEWAAYYEGKIEPFAIQLSAVHTGMTFSDTEQAYGNRIIFTTNRLQYLSPKEKLDTVTQLRDRGLITANEGREIYNMPGIGPEGDKFFIRREYAEVSEVEEGKDEQEGTIQDDGAAGGAES